MSERKERERHFHDERFTADPRSALAGLYTGDLASAAYRDAVLAAARTRRVLEYGCGTGSLAFDVAEVAANVHGIDISPVAVRTATDEAQRRGLTIGFSVMDAEDLDLDDSSFDLVCGSGILHHLDLEVALGEVERVLAPGGQAVFLEPLGHNHLVNLFRRATPSMRTVDEHPLRLGDLELVRARFESAEVRPYHLVGLIGVVPGCPTAVKRLVRRVDVALFGRWPALGRYAWTAVIAASKPVAG